MLKSLNVIVLKNKQSLTRALGADMVIVPSDDGWNDFGFKVRVEIGVADDLGKDYWIVGYLAFEGIEDSAKFIGSIIGEADGIALKSIGRPFASLLFEMKQYSYLRRAVGIERAVSLLREIHDVSLLKAEKKEVPGWPAFFQSEVFQIAFSRSSESYFAFRRGGDVVMGLSTSSEDALRPIRVSITGKKPSCEFSFSFDKNNALRGRIAVIVGRNGSGKTMTLARLAAGFAGSDDKVVFAERPDVNQVLAFAHASSLGLFKRRYSRQSTAVRSFILGVERKSAFTPRDALTQLLVDVVRGHDDDGPLVKHLIDLLDRELATTRLYIPVIEPSATSKKIGSYYEPVDHWMRGGERSRLDALANIDHSRAPIFLDATCRQQKLSLGQLSYFRFALDVLANVGPASVVIVDEPENFLHPNLISQFMRVLHRLLTTTRSVAIIATHSPFVVREVHHNNVHVMERTEDSETVVRKPRLHTLGASVAVISAEVFGDDLPDHLFESLLEQAAIDSLDFNDALNKYAKDLSVEALMMLRARIEGGHA